MGNLGRAIIVDQELGLIQPAGKLLTPARMMGQTEEVSTLNDDENKAGTAKTASKIDLG